jgi:hypothetical protein
MNGTPGQAENPSPSGSGSKSAPQPNQLCSTYPSSAQKGYNYRKKGRKTKFSKNDDLALFQKHLLKHLVDCGMDSIAYIKDPTNSSIMSNVIKEHVRFTLNITQRGMAMQAILYDKYDRENDHAAVDFLMDSLNTDLSKKVDKRLEEADSSPIVWLNLLKLVQSTSIEASRTFTIVSRGAAHPTTQAKTLRSWQCTFAMTRSNW